MGKLLVAGAAEMAGVSYRQMQRIVARYRAGGEEALGHRSRGRSSSRRIDTAERERIVARCREQYGDCGPTYARERLLNGGASGTLGGDAAEVIEGCWDGQGLVSYGATGASAVAATDGV